MPHALRFKILVIEDDESYQDFYQQFFKTFHKDKFAWRLVSSGEEALEYLADNRADLIILDWTLSGISGLETLARIRKKDRFVLTIMVTGRAESQDVCAGLDAGADDYLAKPFAAEALLSHLNSLKRRREASWERDGIYKLGGLKVDLANCYLMVGNRRVELSGKERDLLAVFLRRPGAIHSASYLMETAWGYKLHDQNILERRISSLRAKLGLLWGAKLKSKYGSGYFFEIALPALTSR